MSYPNVQLRALVESLVAYATAKGWSVADVESAFDALMGPMRERERRVGDNRLARELTLERAEVTLGQAMAESWESSVMLPFFDALRLRFPRQHRTIARIDDWAGEASNERAEEDASWCRYERLCNQALRALRRLPWQG